MPATSGKKPIRIRDNVEIILRLKGTGRVKLIYLDVLHLYENCIKGMTFVRRRYYFLNLDSGLEKPENGNSKFTTVEREKVSEAVTHLP
jgi:hypothetical protein